MDSKPWPCHFGDTQWIKIRVPKDVPPPPPDSKWVTKADLQPSQIQDRAERMGDLLSVAEGHVIIFHIHIELDRNVLQAVIQKVNDVLSDVDDDLDLK